MKPADTTEPAKRFLWRSPVIALMALAAAASLVAGGGFALPDWARLHLDRLDLVLAVGFATIWLSDLARASKPAEAARFRRAELFLLASGILAFLALLLIPDTLHRLLAERLHQRAGSLGFWWIRFFLLACVLLQLLRGIEFILRKGLRAELLLAGSFFGIIATGALLLLLPNAMQPGCTALSFVDALFTSTSATCVTGLSVRDTGGEFSTFGQNVIMVLIQIGGLGIVTFVALLSSISNKTLPVPQMVIFRHIINAPAVGDLRRRIAGIVAITLLVETAGAAALFFFVDAGKDTLDHLQWSVFHSISAFCNAGFAFQADSLESLRGNTGALFTIMALIVVGGLGFLVLPEFLSLLRNNCREFLAKRRSQARESFVPRLRLTVQTRLSVITTLALIVLGAAGFALLEGDHVLRGMGSMDFLTASLFQSVTARTAGFNTLPIGELQNATLLLIILLMVVGGCPVSTAGGIKTVTFAILLLGLRALVRGNSRIEAFGRTVPARVISSALNVFLLYMGAAITGLILLSWASPELAMRDLLFECFSALGTVGLSTGVTAQVGTGGKLVLCALMFIGRIGPIAMVLSVFQSSPAVDYEFPQEDVVVG